MTRPGPGFGVYVHWPFCQSKCPYCDFNSHVRGAVDEADWQAALVREAGHMAALAPDREVASVFFGGGTPSLMAPGTVAAVLEAVASHWSMAADAEITLEANPGSVEAGRFEGYRAAGVNRVSIGVQALDDRSLKALGRRHDAAEARAAVTLAQRIFGRVSFDLIHGRMGQTPAGWRRELAEALAFGTDHLSLYQLTIEPGTQFHVLDRRGELDLPCEDARADMYESAQDMTGEVGLGAYEVSNHARPGSECRHNLTYWRSGEWAGIGPGACGRLNRPGGTSIERRQERVPETWLAAVQRRGHGTAALEQVRGADRIAEILMMGLRLADGVSDEDLLRAGGTTWDEAVDPAALNGLLGQGLLVRDARGVRAAPRGRMVLDRVVSRMLDSPARPAA